jgi:hypothetical protein
MSKLLFYRLIVEANDEMVLFSPCHLVNGLLDSCFNPSVIQHVIPAKRLLGCYLNFMSDQINANQNRMMPLNAGSYVALNIKYFNLFHYILSF